MLMLMRLLKWQALSPSPDSDARPGKYFVLKIERCVRYDLGVFYNLGVGKFKNLEILTPLLIFFYFQTMDRSGAER